MMEIPNTEQPSTKDTKQADIKIPYRLSKGQWCKKRKCSGQHKNGKRRVRVVENKQTTIKTDG